MKWGYILVGISVLILLAVLYGQNRRREQFTNMKGGFPSYATLLDQVRLMLDKAYDYDLSELKKMADEQTEMFKAAFVSFAEASKSQGLEQPLSEIVREVGSLPTAESISTAMYYFGKHLPKGVKLNVDTPYDTIMAEYYAATQWVLENMKKPNNQPNPGQGQLPYDQAVEGYYKVQAKSSLLKNLMMYHLFSTAVYRTKAKPKPSGKISIESK
jgi:hypothetical protein